ncbi:MAG: S-layer homology domain-containing protein [Clostridiales bacterium]|nr:S-layer homology domain-containing protein [Clostridiales bacterium]
MKKAVSLILTLILTTSLFATAAYAETGMSNFKKTLSYAEGQYTDVSSKDWFCRNVGGAYEYGLMNGTSDRTFSPSGNVRISEVVALAARLHSIYNTGKASFASGNPWYQPYVDYAVDNGIISKNRFEDYNTYATRYQVAEILASALPASAFPAINDINTGDIPDVSLEMPYECVYVLYRAGVLTGKTAEGNFCPADNVLRSETAAIATRIADESLRVKFSVQPSNGGTAAEYLRSAVKLGRETISLALEHYKAAYAAPNGGNVLTLLSKAKEYATLAADYSKKAAELCKSDSLYSSSYNDIYSSYLGCLSAADYITKLAAAPAAPGADWDSAYTLLTGCGEALSRAAEKIGSSK